MMLEALIARLQRIETLHAGATTDGERIASEVEISERLAIPAPKIPGRSKKP